MTPKVVEPWRGQGKDLHIDAGLVHQLQPLLAEIGETISERTSIQRKRAVVGAGNRAPGLLYLVREDVLFDSDDLHF
ncbi:hypothetical protein [Rhizobium anhuiense]|uniref:hypothetical protein n=1 Tax=Rhizobium anhuiense TaxID=1184720 RepID=UPI001FE03125|nr:hypothetical protein [Rhizobium anhuiense]